MRIQSERHSRITVTQLCSHGGDAGTLINQGNSDPVSKRMKACDWNSQRPEQRAKFLFPQFVR